MARTNIPVYTINRVAYAPYTPVTAELSEGMSFAGNAGRSWVEVDNGGTVLITVGAVVAEAGVDGITIPDKEMDIDPGSAIHFGPFPTVFYSQDDLTVYFDVTAPTDIDGSAVTFQAFTLGTLG
jgi:hypothetical protein